MSEYHLCAQLVGHEQDVRCVDSVGALVVTSSRDRTVRTWGMDGKPVKTL